MNNKKESKLITLRQLHQSGRIWWIRSLPTLVKWIRRDLSGKDLLKTIIRDIGKTKRYYFKTENIETYIRDFEKRTK